MNYEAIQTASAKQPHLALFYGLSCAPCARLKPRLTELCAKLNITLIQINVASEMDTVRRLGFRGVPTLVGLKDGVDEVLFTGDLHNEMIARILIERGYVKAQAE